MDGWMDGVFSPGTVMVHAAYTPLTDAAVMRSGRSVGFTATAHRPPLTALKTAGQQLKEMPTMTDIQSLITQFSFIDLT